MKKDKFHNTNAVRMLDKARAVFESIELGFDEAKTGTEVAEILGVSSDIVYKTLVTVGKSGEHYVFMVPVEEKLDLKKSAKIVNEKFVEPIKQKDLLSLTGYVHGGCSPIGMKKYFRTVICKNAYKYENIYFSAGRIGQQIKMSVSELEKMIPLENGDII